MIRFASTRRKRSTRISGGDAGGVEKSFTPAFPRLSQAKQGLYARETRFSHSSRAKTPSCARETAALVILTCALFLSFRAEPQAESRNLLSPYDRFLHALRLVEMTWGALGRKDKEGSRTVQPTGSTAQCARRQDVADELLSYGAL